MVYIPLVIKGIYYHNKARGLSEWCSCQKISLGGIVWHLKV